MLVFAGGLALLTSQTTLSLMAVLLTVPFQALILERTLAEAIGLALAVIVIIVAHKTNIAKAWQARPGQE